MRRGGRKANDTESTITKLEENALISVFEDFVPDVYGQTFNPNNKLGEYSESTAGTTDGNVNVRKFRKDVISKRMELSDSDTTSQDAMTAMNLYMTYDEQDSRAVRLRFYKGNEEEVKAEISVRSKVDDTHYKVYAVKDLIVDSDDEEGLIRLTKDGSWTSKTYAILDFNKNLSIDKYVYLTLNVPFATNMGWLEPFRKRIYNYVIQTETNQP